MNLFIFPSDDFVCFQSSDTYYFTGSFHCHCSLICIVCHCHCILSLFVLFVILSLFVLFVILSLFELFVIVVYPYSYCLLDYNCCNTFAKIMNE